MPDTIRIADGKPSHLHRNAWILAAAGLLTPARASASDALPGLSALGAAAREHHEYAALAMMLGIVVFAVIISIILLRTRAQFAAASAVYGGQIALYKDAAERANALLFADPQVILSWTAGEETADIIGDPAVAGVAPTALLAFDTWLDPETAKVLSAHVAALRSGGTGFAMPLTTSAGRHLEADGRALAGRVLLRLRDVGGIAARFADLAAEHRRLQDSVEALRALVGALPAPVWTRGAAGRLTFVNPAYARAVERDSASVVAHGIELFDHAAREDLRLGLAAGTAYARRLPAVIGGQRRVLDVLTVPTAAGSAGIGIDATEVEALRSELARMGDAHRRTLDQLSTAVAVFDAQRRLTFYNAAYRALFDLDPALLDQAPTDSNVLEHLRAARLLPEQQDFRQWREQLHQAYQAVETRRHEWYLPDGRMLRVVTTPNPEGGVTYLFDDVTERLDLERRYDALIKVQSETLDNLGEAVAVFGSDGRLRLSNPAFAQMWRLDLPALVERPHIETVIRWCHALDDADEAWDALRTAVTALDSRAPISRRIERRDGKVIDCATVPLPDGATLTTFTDVTAAVNEERALVERNEALVAADVLKVDFLKHVSYELRSPLTNIIGFAHFLDDPTTGPLNERQREYLGYITFSTNALLAIINNILDLATIDAGAMTLDLGEVDIRTTMQAAVEGVQDRLATEQIALDLRAEPEIGSFVADERRIRQVLFNLLSNAIGFSPPGGRVTLVAERTADAIVFSVRDEGPGIPSEMLDRVFDWFETHPLGSRHRGAGLGLSLVRSFVELHGGRVEIDSNVGHGTAVTCTFPLDRTAARTAAE